MAKYSRSELEKMIELFKQAIENAESSGDWVKHLGPLYTDDALYQWNIGPNQEFRAQGRKEIEAYALDAQMEGLEDWEYPYYDFVIDEDRSEVIGFFRQISPVKREDGTNYEVEGVSGSRFHYGGNYQWCEQKDFFDFGNLKALFIELAAVDGLKPELKKNIQNLATGQLLPGNYLIRPKARISKKLRGVMAMTRIALLGR